MNVEQLLLPRIKVTGNYPNSPYKIGEVLFPLREMDIENAEKYPHLFRIMPWYEDRDINDMPKYVRTMYAGFTGVYKVEWEMSKSAGMYRTIITQGENGALAWVDCCTPAAREEYLLFKYGVMSILEKLSDNRVVSFEIKNDVLVVTEGCDEFFSESLTKSQVLQLIEELKNLADKLPHIIPV